MFKLFGRTLYINEIQSANNCQLTLEIYMGMNKGNCTLNVSWIFFSLIPKLTLHLKHLWVKEGPILQHKICLAFLYVHLIYLKLIGPFFQENHHFMQRISASIWIWHFILEYTSHLWYSNIQNLFISLRKSEISFISNTVRQVSRGQKISRWVFFFCWPVFQSY